MSGPDGDDEWAPLDDAYRSFATATEDPPWGSLISQTLITAGERRGLLAALGVRPGWHCLDVGTGYGPIPFELAHIAAVRAVGTDVDEALLGAARAIASEVERTHFYAPGASVSFRDGDAYALPFADEQFDLLTARLVFQHLSRPEAAASEARRVLRHGGLALVYDVDDGLACSWPEPPDAVARLDRAYQSLQRARGGDRDVGRKLSGYLAAAGLEVLQVLVLPHAAHEAAGTVDEAREVTLARHQAARTDLLASDLLDNESFDGAVAALRDAAPADRCRIECQVAVLARKA